MTKEQATRKGILSPDTVKKLRHRFCEPRADLQTLAEESRAHDEIARNLHELRTSAGYTQGQLGRLAGTTGSVISKLEQATFEGHSLTILRRIGAALNQRLEVRFVPIPSAEQRD